MSKPTQEQIAARIMVIVETDPLAILAGQHLCAKDQTELILKSWGQQLPKKNEVLYVSFAKQHLNLCTVMLSSYRPTYDKPLYLIEFRYVAPEQVPEVPKDIVLCNNQLQN